MNSIGFRTLLKKEISRFLKVPGQTLAQPVIMTSLYFLVFGFALGGRVRELDGIPYVRFIVPGLVMLGVIQNAFLNTASSLFIMKVQGTIVDLLVAPIGTAEILSAFVLGGIARGLMVGAIVWIVSGVFVGFHVAHPLFMIASIFVVAATFSCAGLVVAIWSEKFEQLNIVPTFVLTPLTFLGGVFYSVSLLPQPWSTITRLNPVLYMVDGLRYGLLGVESVPAGFGLALTAGFCLVAGGTAWWMLATGFRLRK